MESRDIGMATEKNEEGRKSVACITIPAHCGVYAMLSDAAINEINRNCG